MQPQEGSSSYYQEQFQQPSDEELVLALKEEIKRDNEALQIRLPIMETKMNANMIAYMGPNSKYLSKELYAIMKRMAKQAEKLEKVIRKQSSRQLPERHKE